VPSGGGHGEPPESREQLEERVVADSGLSGQHIVVTGASGNMGFPVAMALTRDNDVTAVARFRDEADAQSLRDAGATVVPFDQSSADLSPLPERADVVFHFGAMTAFPTSPEERRLQFEVNIRAAGRLAMRYRDCRAFVHASATTYKFQGERRHTEDDPPGLLNGLENYCASKIAAEQLLQFLSREHGIPTVMLRISSCYGPRGGSIAGRVERVRAGEPVLIYPGLKNNYCPMYETDYVEKAIASASLAATPPETLNFAGSETCSIEEYCAIAGELCGTEPILQESPDAIQPVWPDTTKMERLLGKTSVSPRDGIRMVLELGEGARFGRWSGWKEPSEPTTAR
jgi:nucleoside-diphosphate-sugar epimerase